jgi:PAS domain-containing protein
MHQLLSRQIKKYLPSTPEDSDEFNEFLNIVSETYRLYEQELAHLTESKKLNEVESHKANEPLNNRAEERKESIDKLKETLQKTGISENSINLENDIFHLSKILEEQKEITTDINNELKNNIQRLRTLIHNHPSAILLETETRKIAFTNQSFCNLFPFLNSYFVSIKNYNITFNRIAIVLQINLKFYKGELKKQVNN